MGEPITLTEINLAGVCSRSAREGEQVEILVRASLTSDQAFFHRIVVNLAAAMEHSARADGSHVRLDRAGMILLVIKPDNSGELWVDAAATSMSTALKRPGPLSAGTVLFENDIADVTGIWFPHVKVGKKDRIVCLFREGWRFGLFFDFNPDGKLAIEDAMPDRPPRVRAVISVSREGERKAALPRPPPLRKSEPRPRRQRPCPRRNGNIPPGIVGPNPELPSWHQPAQPASWPG